MKKLLFLVLALSFISAPARSDTLPPLIVITGQCSKYTMCAAQTATGDCTVNPASGDELVLPAFALWSSLTFFSNQSVGSPYTCHVHGNNTGHDAESGDFVQLTTTPLSDTQEAISLGAGMFGHFWLNCSVITTDITITVNVCPANR